MALTDANGTVHEVSISEVRRDYWTAGGTLRGSCLCGWDDQISYDPGNPLAEALTANFADLKLRERAAAHVPVAVSAQT